MKEKFIKFVIIALMALFSARMACADSIQQVKYPYVEKVEIGYKLYPLDMDSAAVAQAIKQKTVVNKEEKKVIGGLDVLVIFVGVLMLLAMGFGAIYFVILFLGIITLLMVKIFHKKR